MTDFPAPIEIQAMGRDFLARKAAAVTDSTLTLNGLTELIQDGLDLLAIIDAALREPAGGVQ